MSTSTDLRIGLLTDVTELKLYKFPYELSYDSDSVESICNLFVKGELHILEILESAKKVSCINPYEKWYERCNLRYCYEILLSKANRSVTDKYFFMIEKFFDNWFNYTRQNGDRCRLELCVKGRTPDRQTKHFIILLDKPQDIVYGYNKGKFHIDFLNCRIHFITDEKFMHDISTKWEKFDSRKPVIEQIKGGNKDGNF